MIAKTPRLLEAIYRSIGLVTIKAALRRIQNGLCMFERMRLQQEFCYVQVEGATGSLNIGIGEWFDI